MGRRRKRSNSDNDESLEESYSKNHRQPYADKDAGPAGELNALTETKSILSTSTTSSSDEPRLLPPLEKTSSSVEVVSDKEQKRLERLRQQKKRRKLQKKAKALTKKETTDKQSNAENSSKESQLNASSSQKKENPNTEFKIIAKGIKYRDVSIGKGPLVQDRKKIRVSYMLRSQHRYGKILDSSNDFRFRLGRGEVIKGWDLGIMGMRQGGKRYLIVPPNAGYGGRDVGAGKGGLLFFELTLLDC